VEKTCTKIFSFFGCVCTQCRRSWGCRGAASSSKIFWQNCNIRAILLRFGRNV